MYPSDIILYYIYILYIYINNYSLSVLIIEYNIILIIRETWTKHKRTLPDHASTPSEVAKKTKKQTNHTESGEDVQQTNDIIREKKRKKIRLAIRPRKSRRRVF